MEQNSYLGVKSVTMARQLADGTTEDIVVFLPRSIHGPDVLPVNAGIWYFWDTWGSSVPSTGRRIRYALLKQGFLADILYSLYGPIVRFYLPSNDMRNGEHVRLECVADDLPDFDKFVYDG